MPQRLEVAFQTLKHWMHHSDRSGMCCQIPVIYLQVASCLSIMYDMPARFGSINLDTLGDDTARLATREAMADSYSRLVFMPHERTNSLQLSIYRYICTSAILSTSCPRDIVHFLSHSVLLVVTSMLKPWGFFLNPALRAQRSGWIRTWALACHE